MHQESAFQSIKTTYEEPSDEETDDPSNPDVSPVVLVAVDAREGVDDGQTDEAEDEEGTQQRSSAQVDHVIDVALNNGNQLLFSAYWIDLISPVGKQYLNERFSGNRKC